MTDSVKRTYSSQLRAAHGRETRRLIVSAAARLFTDHGFTRTTVDAIAEEAGVSRKTVFSAVGGKAELLKLALDWAIVGDDEPIALEHRPALSATKQATDPAAIIRGWVEVVTTIAARVAGLTAALAGAATADDDARQLWNQSQRQRLTGARAFIDHLAAHGGLRAGLSPDHAADIAWLHSDPAIYRRLVIERGWTRPDFEAWLLRAITSQLLN